MAPIIPKLFWNNLPRPSACPCTHVHALQSTHLTCTIDSTHAEIPDAQQMQWTIERTTHWPDTLPAACPNSFTPHYYWSWIQWFRPTIAITLIQLSPYWHSTQHLLEAIHCQSGWLSVWRWAVVLQSSGSSSAATLCAEYTRQAEETPWPVHPAHLDMLPPTKSKG